MRGSGLFTNALRGAIVAALLSIFSVPVVASDFCAGWTPGFSNAFEGSRAVFTGEVVKISKPTDLSPGAALRKQLYEVTFKVEYSWKGAGFQEVGPPKLMVLSSQGTDSSCSHWGVFVEGRRYLVYAYETPEKELIVSNASRTVRLENASDDLKQLRRLGIFRDEPSKSFGLPAFFLGQVNNRRPRAY